MKYFLIDEVVTHNKWDDFWVVIHGNVLNLSPMLKDRRELWNANLEYLLSFGGKDISQFFNEHGAPKTETYPPQTGESRPLFLPILEVAESRLCKTPGRIWSQDPLYRIGQITRRERRIRIVNTLTGNAQYMRVCDEETIGEIMQKYKRQYNTHADIYKWRKNSFTGVCPKDLYLNATLDDNGLTEPDGSLNLPPPSIWLYYADNITIA